MAGPTYTYTSNTPNASDAMNVTQPLILDNFRAISELVTVNHVGFNTSDFGKHKFISMPNTTTPGPISNVITMFTEVTGSPNPCEIFIQYPDGGTEDVIQVSNTENNVASGTSGGTSSEGWCSFSSGIIFRWGTFATSGSANPPVTINIGNAGPQFTANDYPSAVSPTSSGCLVVTGIFIFPGSTFTSGQTVTSGVVYTAFYGYTSVSTVVNFNYLLMGT